MQLVDTPVALADAVNELTAQADKQNDLAVDTERASGFRYSQRPYLIQIFTAATGTYLIDTVSVGDLQDFAQLLASAPLIFHAAAQDIPSLREVDIHPQNIFDTELAARLAGYKKFGLQALAEEILDIQLDKAFSAVDWSTRPLPSEWLDYAALDVEILPELKSRLTEILTELGRLKIAFQEFKTVVKKPPKKPLAEPWRKLSGLHTLKSSRQLAVARELWNARDEYARSEDIAPGRLIPDRSIIFAASLLPKSKSQLARAKEFQGKESRSLLQLWFDAVKRGMESEDLPSLRVKRDSGSLSTKTKIEISEQVQLLKEAALEVAEEQDLQLELLVTKDTLSKLVVSGNLTKETSSEEMSSILIDLGLRQWQVDLLSEPLLNAFKTIPTKAQNNNG